jgi:hypothetical protein
VIAGLALSTLEIARPLGFLALALPVALLLGARVLARPEPLATGTLAIWRRVHATSVPAAPHRSRRIPPAVLLLALGLALGSFALAGPRIAELEAARIWRLLVDGSASMDLPYALGASETRRDRAEATARAWLALHAPAASVRRVLLSGAFSADDDAEDAIWITDRAPSPPPSRASWFASGGPAVPGAVAVDGTTRFDWDGRAIVAVEGGAPRRSVAVRGTLPRPVAGVLDAWAAARNAVVGGDGRASLLVSTAGEGPAFRAEASRDGWSASVDLAGAAPSSDDGGPLESWIAEPSGRRLVAFGRGRVACPWTSMEEPRGDPAAFAVSWGSLFDRAALPPPGVVALAERASAGDEASRPPRASADRASTIRESLLPALLGFAACACVAGAGWLGRRW